MISLIIPFYNCEYTAEKTILTVKDFISEYCEPVEFIAVNDGSTDSTHDILKRFAGGSVRLVSYEKNKGKGGAIKEGVFAASGEKIIFTDADLAYGLSPVEAFSKALDTADIAVGTRRSDREILKSYGFIRNLSSNIFSMICELYLGIGIDDTQCGIKGYRAEAAKKLFSALTINGFGFDLEILTEARLHNMKIAQIPVKLLNNEKNSNVSIIADGLEMLKELGYIRKKIKKERNMK